ncbi:MAG TPA: FtsL-like putative cell division protein, partial [Bacteroidia bacterium]|nr:FtsL-like putative cell division protein [Bacteroidia bacterium]
MSKNTIKEVNETPQKPKQKSGGGNIVTRSVGAVLSGAFLSREKTIRALPFIFFITFIALCYIANGYYAEEQIRKQNKLTNEIKDLYSDYVISQSDLSAISTRDPVAKRVRILGLKDTLQKTNIIRIHKLDS